MKKTVRTAAIAMLATPLVAAVFAAPASATEHDGSLSGILGSIDTASLETLGGSIEGALGSADLALGSAELVLGSVEDIFGSPDSDD
ncbi:hypothetical protein [Rhodococcus sp. NPDC049939]|uniref:hypothetical protein n=1 Tax=Rhodococcus sp. NPDC049939 TaxID=3155511 RepID=UPI00340D5C09